MKVYRITCKATIAVAVIVRRSLQLKLAFVAFSFWLRSGLVSMIFLGFRIAETPGKVADIGVPDGIMLWIIVDLGLMTL